MNLIRPIAVCVFRRLGRILVAEGLDPHKKEVFYRPLGGMIEFGERAESTIRREIREELNTEVADLKYLGLLESIFSFDGQVHHELVLVYDGRFSNTLLYEASQLTGKDSGESTPFKVIWKRLEEFTDESPPLYPDGLLDLVR